MEQQRIRDYDDSTTEIFVSRIHDPRTSCTQHEHCTMQV